MSMHYDFTRTNTFHDNNICIFVHSVCEDDRYKDRQLIEAFTSLSEQPPFILTARQLFKLANNCIKLCPSQTFNRLLPREEGTNNKIAKVANGQNKNNLYSEKKKKVAAHLTFLQKINFCPFYGWVIVSVNSTGPQGGGGGVGVGGGAGIYCNRPWSLAPLLLYVCWSVSGENKPWSVTPISTQLLTSCVVTPLPGSDAVISQLASGAEALPLKKTKKKKTKQNKKNQKKMQGPILLFPLTVQCAQYAGCYFGKPRVRAVTWHWQRQTGGKCRYCGRASRGDRDREREALNVDRYHMIEWDREQLKVAAWA